MLLLPSVLMFPAFTNSLRKCPVLSWRWSTQRTASSSHLRHQATHLLWRASQPNICQPLRCGDRCSRLEESRRDNAEKNRRKVSFQNQNHAENNPYAVSAWRQGLERETAVKTTVTPLRLSCFLLRSGPCACMCMTQKFEKQKEMANKSTWVCNILINNEWMFDRIWRSPSWAATLS